MLHRVYSAVMNIYQKINKSKISIAKLPIEMIVCLFVIILQLSFGIKFPKRAIGGWWWTWRLRFEILTGFYDYSIVQYCRKSIKPGMVVVDIGAHVGYYTWLFSKLVGPSGKVISYEPSPENYLILVQNIKAKHLKNVVAIQKAVSDISKQVKFYISPGNSNHSIIKGFTKYEEVIEVTSTTIDLDLPELGIKKVDFIKIDAEGAEPAILHGMEHFLKISDKIILIVEMNPSALKASSIKPTDLLEQLSKLNLNASIILEDGSFSIDFPSFIDQTVNVLCFHKKIEKIICNVRCIYKKT